MIKNTFNVLAFTCIFIQCTGAAPKQTDMMSKDKIQETVHIKLPESAKNFHVHSETGIDSASWLRFECTTDDAVNMLQASGFAELKSDFRYLTNFQLADTEWWKPDAVPNFRSGEISLETSRGDWSINILLGSTGSPDWCTVYLFETTL